MPPQVGAASFSPTAFVGAAVVAVAAVAIVAATADNNALSQSCTPATGGGSAGAVYQIGDSMTIGMDTKGNLRQAYANNGSTVVQIEATAGIGIAASTAKVKADMGSVLDANTAVVELGTYDYSATAAANTRAIEGLVKQLRAANPALKIYWVNTHFSANPAAEQSINRVITSQAGPDKYTVIDWNAEAKNHPSKYHFDVSDGEGVYQATAAGYRALATFIADQVSGGSTGRSGTGSDPLNDPIKAVSTVHTGKQVSIDNQLAVSMHFGSNIEDVARDPAAEGGGGFGWYQIQKIPIDYHPDISIFGTEDPWISTRYMVSEYRSQLAIFNATSSGMWKTDPERAAETVADMAERPQFDYYVNRASAVPVAFQLALKQLAASGISTDLTSRGSGSSSQGSQSFAGSSIQQLASDQGGCGPTPSGEIPPPSGSESKQRTSVLTATNNVVGTMYAWAGGNVDGPTYGQCVGGAAANDCNIQGFDCSGLVLYALAQGLGKSFVAKNLQHGNSTHSAADQYQTTRAFTVATSLSDLSRAQPGDLIFFTGDDGSVSSPGHVGIYIGNGRMISAPQSGERVQIADVVHSSFWQSEFVAITNPYAWAQSLHA